MWCGLVGDINKLEAWSGEFELDLLLRFFLECPMGVRVTSFMRSIHETSGCCSVRRFCIDRLLQLEKLR